MPMVGGIGDQDMRNHPYGRTFETDEEARVFEEVYHQLDAAVKAKRVTRRQAGEVAREAAKMVAIDGDEALATLC